MENCSILRKAAGSFSWLLFLDIVVVDLDTKDDNAACSGNEVGDEQGPERSRLMADALKHEAGTTNAHHQKGR